MANILLLDDNPVAQKALAGILGRADHKFAAVNTSEAALSFIRKNAAVDLFITDLRLQSSGLPPIELIRKIRSNVFLKTMPIVIYTSVAGRENVKAALSLRIQNYLIKPYSDAKIYTEVKRAEEWGWINGQFDDAKTFCGKMNLPVDAWEALLKELLGLVRSTINSLEEAVAKTDLAPCAEQLGRMIGMAEKCGFWALYDLLNEIIGAADRKQWIAVHAHAADLPIAEGFLAKMLEPDRDIKGFVDADQFGLTEKTLAPDSWLRDEVLARAPFASREDTEAALDKLPAFPVFASRAASFRLTADGHGASVQPVVDLVVSDPGLSALVIQEINRIENDPDSPIEDSGQAAQMLGGRRLHDAVSLTNPVPEDRFLLPPNENWQKFLLYQLGCANVCAFICEFMEIPIFMPHAYWAGLLHDMGKMALTAIYKEAYVAAARIASDRVTTLDDAYVRLIGMTPQEAGARVAKKHCFPYFIVDVIRNLRDPAHAENKELVAIVAFSSALCLRYNIGSNGAPPISPDAPLDSLPGWEILKERVFPSFDLVRFGDVMTAWSEDLRLRLSGHSSFVTD